MKRILKEAWNWLLLALSHSGALTNKAVDDGICDLSGQGRSKYGR